MTEIYKIIPIVVTSGCVAFLMWWAERLFFPLRVTIHRAEGEPIDHGWAERRRRELNGSSGIEGL